ncbi:MAG: DUF3300 domain-containing protein, partial [Gammaproteobacteria bacterium]|nr:DUF3300 domain-containing protein [Gammaproteobacteria bacterium]
MPAPTRFLAIALLALALAPPPAAAQSGASAVPADDAYAAVFSPAELDQMLAPIALHPDVLLSTILMASTYPLEIVQAARWSRENPQLSGEAAVAEAARYDWDPAVQALVAFPDILQRLDEDLDWTQRLGDAFLYQEADVMDSVQHLRSRAAQAGHLRSDDHVRVVERERVVVIEPVRERIVHVPWYDTRVVYGSWWHPYYPPVAWYAPVHYRAVRPGFYWSSGFVVSPGFFFSTVYWPQRHVLVLHSPRHFYVPHYRTRPHHYAPGKPWRHEPRHRRGVAYRHPEVRDRYRHDARGSQRTAWEGSRQRLQAPSQGARRSDAREQYRQRGEGRDRGTERVRSSGERDRGELANTWQQRDRGGDVARGDGRQRAADVGQRLGGQRLSGDGTRPDGEQRRRQADRPGEAGAPGSANNPRRQERQSDARQAYLDATPRMGGGASAANRPARGDAGQRSQQAPARSAPARPETNRSEPNRPATNRSEVAPSARARAPSARLAAPRSSPSAAPAPQRRAAPSDTARAPR